MTVDRCECKRDNFLYNEYIHLREDGTWVLFHVAFLFIFISHNLCAISGRDGGVVLRSLTNAHIVQRRPIWPKSRILLIIGLHYGLFLHDHNVCDLHTISGSKKYLDTYIKPNDSKEI